MDALKDHTWGKSLYPLIIYTLGERKKVQALESDSSATFMYVTLGEVLHLPEPHGFWVDQWANAYIIPNIIFST